MAQAGYTPISLYFSTTAAAVPVNTNLANGELAINITDGKLYYKDNGGTVRLLASNATSAPVLSFSAGTTGFTPSTATTGAITLAGTLATTNGGTGLTSFTSGGVLYASSTSALATGSALTFDGTNFATTGSATATRFIPSGSTVATNGMYLPAADTLGFSTASTERMRISSIGAVGIGTTALAQFGLRVSKTITGSVASYGVRSDGVVQSDVTSQAFLYNATGSTAASAFTLSELRYFSADQGTIGAGSAVTSQYGFIASPTLTGATNNYGFYGDIASGTGRFNLYMNGTADNYLAGSLGIGTLGTTGSALIIGKNITGATSAFGTQITSTVQSDVTSGAFVYSSQPSTQAASFTLAGISHFVAAQGTIGAGSSVTNQYGFFAGTSLTGATNNYGFFGNIASGTGRYNLYMAGTAYNYLGGNTGIGVTSAITSNARLSVISSGDYDAGLAIGSTASAANWARLDFKNTNAASPAIIYQDQTGFFNLRTDGAYAIAFSTNGANERFRIASTGAFGLSGANYGTSGQVLTSGGSGAAPTWTTVSGGGGTPGGSNTQVQYNSSGSFGASSSFTFTSGSNLTIGTSSDTIGVSSLTGKLVVSPTAVAANNFAWAAKFQQNGSYSDGSITALGFSVEGGYTRAAFGYVRGTAGYDVGAFTWYLASNATVGTTVSYTEERMRLDYLGRLGIGTTAATTNLARLQVTHDPSNDRYGIYVPGGSYVGSGPSGANYGGWFKPHVSNSTGTHVGVYGEAGAASVGSAQYGGYFDGKNSASTPSYGVYGTARQSDFNGPAFVYGGWFNANSSGSSPGGSGGTVALMGQNSATLGGTAVGVWALTSSGPTNIYGYYYEHQGGLQFRVKSNGGIDNYSGNNTNLSDRREKTDFAPAKSYLETICAIPVQTFKFINQEDDLLNLGVVAQDVQAVAPELVNESDWGSKEEPKVRLSVYETDLMYALMKSIQELNAKFEEYKALHP
jgi:hypothetical protein